VLLTQPVRPYADAFFWVNELDAVQWPSSSMAYAAGIPEVDALHCAMDLEGDLGEVVSCLAFT